jgi:hypothetical protein
MKRGLWSGGVGVVETETSVDDAQSRCPPFFYTRFQLFARTRGWDRPWDLWRGYSKLLVGEGLIAERIRIRRVDISVREVLENQDVVKMILGRIGMLNIVDKRAVAIGHGWKS